MDKKGLKEINSRIGKLQIEPDKEIYFPRGLIGFERLRTFTLVQLKGDSPFLLLQSTENARFGMVVADPYAFLTDYKVSISAVDQRLLKVRGVRDLSIMVSVSIPPGNPERATLNLTGPLLINNVLRIGLQAPQIDCPSGGHVLLSELVERTSQDIVCSPKQDKV